MPPPHHSTTPREGEGAGPLFALLLSQAESEKVAQAIAVDSKAKHPAVLNIGECSSYALSKFTGEPLLFIGEEFAKTDVAQVI
ncbi:MAG: type II toxin-antitoxin system VapC family toxin [Spirochaetia bacterium]